MADRPLRGMEEAVIGGPVFTPPLYKQRYQAVIELARVKNAGRVIDMGCAECKLLQLLKREEYIEELIGVDISTALSLSAPCLRPLVTDYLHPRLRPLTVKLMQGSIADPDARLVNFHLMSCIEVIEHLDPPILERIPHSIFGVMQPQTVIMTTPNAEFNVLFPDFSGFRHLDHRFEWTRREFELWSLGITRDYPYDVVFSGVGEPPSGKEHLGHCSQMAVFTRIKAMDEVDLSGVGTPYEIVEECTHPHIKYPLSLETQLCQQAEYYLHLLHREKESGADYAGVHVEGSQEVMEWIDLKELLRFKKISQLCCSVDSLRSALKMSQIAIVDSSGKYAALRHEDTHSDLEEEEDGQEGGTSTPSVSPQVCQSAEPYTESTCTDPEVWC